MTEKEERLFYIQSLYNEYLEKTENRNTSYGELIYIQELEGEELDKFEDELIDELNKIEEELK